MPRPGGRERQVLLPGVSTLVRLVGRVRKEAQLRFWDTLAGLPTRSQTRQLEGLLEVPLGARVSDLDRSAQGARDGIGQVDGDRP